MARYRKKPIEIEAFQVKEHPWPEWGVGGILKGQIVALGRTAVVKTKEGDMRADEEDWIIKGIEGELYPCKPSIFEATYDPCP